MNIFCNDIAVDLFARSSSPCSQQGSQRALPVFFPTAAIIGSGRCHYRPRPLPTKKAWSFSRFGMAWSQFVAAFFLSSLLLWKREVFRALSAGTTTHKQVNGYIIASDIVR